MEILLCVPACPHFTAVWLLTACLIHGPDFDFFRHNRLEESMTDEGLTDYQKKEKRSQHAQRETDFLRLKRSRLGVDDFDPLKVIGKGAFGEVSRTRYGTFLPPLHSSLA